MPISARLPAIACKPRFWWTAYAAWFLILFVLSSFSAVPAGTPVFMLSDKVAHAAYFTAGTAALFWALALRGGSLLASNHLLILAICIAAAALVGWFDEWHQSHTPGRSGNDIGDWIADVIGGLLGFLAGKIGLRFLRG